MTDEYRQFPTRNGAQRALHRVVTLLAAGRPVLTHCFAGKDRTGFVIATVLGADRHRPRHHRRRFSAQQ